MVEIKVSFWLSVFNKAYEKSNIPWIDVLATALYYADKWDIRLEVFKQDSIWCIKIADRQWEVIGRY